MNIKFLADCPEVIGAIACLHHQMEMQLGVQSNYHHSVKKFRLRLNRESLPLALVAFADDTLPVGSVSLVTCDLPSHSHLEPWLASLFVATPYQSRGIGYKLVQQIDLIATRMGYQQLYLFTWTAERYYRKLGWTVIDRTQPEGLPESVVIALHRCVRTLF